MASVQYMKEAFAVARELRGKGFRASILYDNSAAADTLKEQFRDQAAPWVLLIKSPGLLQLKSSAQRVTKDLTREHLGKAVAAVILGGNGGREDVPKRGVPHGSGHHDPASDGEDPDERSDGGVKVILVLASNLRSADVSRRHCVLTCRNAFRDAFGPQAFPHALVFACGLPLIEVRTAVSVFLGIAAMPTDSRARHLQPIINVLRDHPESRKHAHIFIFSFPDHSFELVPIQIAAPKHDPSGNQRRLKRKKQPKHGPWDPGAWDTQ